MRAQTRAAPRPRGQVRPKPPLTATLPGRGDEIGERKRQAKDREQQAEPVDGMRGDTVDAVGQRHRARCGCVTAARTMRPIHS